MKMRTPPDLSHEDLDRLLAADQRFAAALEPAAPFLGSCRGECESNWAGQ
jgi:hypothetical protein